MKITYSNFVVTESGDMPLEKMGEEERKKAGNACRRKPLATLGQVVPPKD